MIAGIAFAIGYSFMSFIFDWDEAVMGGCDFCGEPERTHEPSGCCGDGGGSTFERTSR